MEIFYCAGVLKNDQINDYFTALWNNHLFDIFLLSLKEIIQYKFSLFSRMVLDKEIQKPGMILPFSADIYRPMIDRWDCVTFQFLDTNQNLIFQQF